MEKSKVYFRADGNSQMGLGHVIRSLALAEMLAPLFECHFIIRNPLASIKAQILNTCHSIIELPETNDHLSEAQTLVHRFQPFDIVVLDGYYFRTEYQRIIKESGCKLVCIDDIYAYHFVADVVVNHAPSLDPKVYSIAPYTQLCLGVDYSLLRKPFLEAAKTKRAPKKIETLFICFGGSDFNNCTSKILLEIIKDPLAIKKVEVVLGSANPHIFQVKRLAQLASHFQVNIHQNLSANQMVNLLEHSDLAIVPSSGILYEAICIQLPIISGYYVDNQIKVYEGFKALDIIIGVDNINQHENFSFAIQKAMESNFQETYDKQHALQHGQSTQNFLKLFTNLTSHENDYVLRPVQEEDSMLLYQWANDKQVRINALNSEPITFDTHTTWFTKKIQDPNTIMFILMRESIPLGQIRFEIIQKKASITYSIDQSFRGRGLGKKILKFGIQALIRVKKDQIKEIVAKVKTSNPASNKIFTQLNFELSQIEQHPDFDLNIYTYDLNQSL
ncbi:MAG: UDP-2,4-diacetamido-2,4,6-trideoxy-beta-L-altropyranose hydrolase [Saprospiraceae bacterium]